MAGWQQTTRVRVNSGAGVPRHRRQTAQPRGHQRVVLENAGDQDQGIAFAPVGADGTTCLKTRTRASPARR